jgi:tetratricopeptide (TPR) repeat protein
MKSSLFIFCPFLFAGFIFLLFKTNRETSASITSSPAIGCGPGTIDFPADATGKFIRLLPGWGTHSYTISTSNDSAQIYFNQGLSMYYSYHMREAVASFKEAARFDSSCAMAYWGQALAMGPTYNSGYSYKMNKAVPKVVEYMNQHAAQATAKEKDLLMAMNKRYRVTDTADRERKQLNYNYAEAMKPLVEKYADDLDIKALYTDAVMLIHPWDFWNNDGTPKAWTPELVGYCEQILAKDPHHPAALHYYIHITEASRKPEVALSSADSLIKLFPGIAHMVHMSSHEYERIGYYAKGVNANEKADQSLVIYDSLAKGLFPQVHVMHYFAVDAFCAFSGAMEKKAIQKTHNIRSTIKPTKEDFYSQHLYMFPQYARLRLGKWQDILNDNTPISKDWTFSLIIHHFAHGMARAKTGKIALAQNHLQQIRQLKKDEALKEKFDPMSSSPLECSEIAENILLANILFQQKNYPASINALKQAIHTEDSLIYEEPKLWVLPARQYLGAFLLDMKRAGEAEKVYREDLVWNPRNGWSLLGLYQALKAQGKKNELDSLKKLYTASFSHAEILPLRSAL